jgi:hypothetical protein
MGALHWEMPARTSVLLTLVKDIDIDQHARGQALHNLLR